MRACTCVAVKSVSKVIAATTAEVMAGGRWEGKGRELYNCFGFVVVVAVIVMVSIGDRGRENSR